MSYYLTEKVRESDFSWENLPQSFRCNPSCLEFTVSMLLVAVWKCWKIFKFSKISIKMKKFKTFYQGQTGSCLKEIIKPPPDRSFLRLWNKHFLTDIYISKTTFAFQVVREWSSRTSRNDAVQTFFLTSARNMFAGTFIKWVRFFAVLREYIFYNVERAEVRKMSEVFWAKRYSKMSNLFCYSESFKGLRLNPYRF